MKMFKFLTVAAIAAVALSSCKKDDDNDDNNNNTSASTFRVRMTDSPGNYSAMNVQVTKVEAYIENQGWVTLNSSSQNMSILDLTNGEESSIGYNGSAQTGHYTKVRLTMGTNNTVTTHDNAGDHTYTMNWVGSSDNTVTVDIDKYVNAGTQGSVLLDFDAAGSATGDILNNYSFNPMIRWIEDENTGVKGTMTGADQAMIQFSNGAHTYATYMANGGQFMIRGMANGTYHMMVEGMHTGESTIDNMDQDGVIVTDGQITNMGSITFN